MEPEDSLGGHSKKSGNSLNPCPYNSSKSNGDIGVEVASKYISRPLGSYNPQGLVKTVNYSSSDDSDSEFSCMPLGLVGLAAKHKNTIPVTAGLKTGLASSAVDPQGVTLTDNRLLNSIEYSSNSEKKHFFKVKCVTDGTKGSGPVKSVNSFSSDDDSDSESSSMPFSLLGLAAKYKKNTPMHLETRTVSDSPTIVSQTMTLKNNSFLDSCDLLHDSEEEHKVKNTGVVDGCVGIEAAKQHGKVYVANRSHNLRVQDLTTKFVAAHFTSDSDSDESVSQTRSSDRETSCSTGDVRAPHPNVREVQSLVNYHRQHTKSESDRFSSGAFHPSDSFFRENPINNVSTSLRSLRGGGYKDLGFQFSPGSSIPGSFKSLKASNSLTSSSVSVGIDGTRKGPGSYTDITDAYSDPDVSVGSKHSDNQRGGRRDLSDVKNSSPFRIEKSIKPNSTDVVDGGINLSCALKTSSSTRTSESMMSEDSIELLDDAEDEEIVTLLDAMEVDDAQVDEKLKKHLLSKNELDESCTIDMSNILKVKLKLRTRKCSSFGKVICRRWRSLKTPYIIKEKLQTTVVPFQFLEPSPDDVIANPFKRRL